MSYSFAVSGSSKADVIAKVAAEFDKVAANQPTHGSDKDAAVTAAGAFVGLLQEPTDGQKISVNMSGSLGWNYSDAPPTAFVSASVSVSAFISKQS